MNFLSDRQKFWKFELSLPDKCSGGGIGRHAGLKIPWTEMSVRVRFPSGARGAVTEHCSAKQKPDKAKCFVRLFGVMGIPFQTKKRLPIRNQMRIAAEESETLERE